MERQDKFIVGDKVSFLIPDDPMAGAEIDNFERLFGLGPYLITKIEDVPVIDIKQAGHSQFLYSDRWVYDADVTKFSGGWFFAIPRLNEVVIRVE